MRRMIEVLITVNLNKDTFVDSFEKFIMINPEKHTESIAKCK